MDAPPPHCLFYSAARVPDALLEKRNPRGPGPQILSSAAPFIFSPPLLLPRFRSAFFTLTYFQFLLLLRSAHIAIKLLLLSSCAHT